MTQAKSKAQDYCPIQEPGLPLYPPELNAYLLHKSRVQAIAHKKLRAKVTHILQTATIQQFMKTTFGEILRRSELETEHWEAIAAYLNLKSTLDAVHQDLIEGIEEIEF